MEIVDKLENLQEVFNAINEHLNLGKVEISTESDAPAGFYLSTDGGGEVQYMISVPNGQMVYSDLVSMLNNRLFKFIGDSNIEINEYTRTVIVLLCQFGHISILNIMNAVSGGLLADPAFQDLVAEQEVPDEESLSISEAMEHQAEEYAMKHFIAVYNMLKSKNLIQ